jgi:hypothetical protein
MTPAVWILGTLSILSPVIVIVISVQKVNTMQALIQAQIEQLRTEAPPVLIGQQFIVDSLQELKTAQREIIVRLERLERNGIHTTSSPAGAEGSANG